MDFLKMKAWVNQPHCLTGRLLKPIICMVRKATEVPNKQTDTARRLETRHCFFIIIGCTHSTEPLTHCERERLHFSLGAPSFLSLLPLRNKSFSKKDTLNSKCLRLGSHFVVFEKEVAYFSQSWKIVLWHFNFDVDKKSSPSGWTSL